MRRSILAVAIGTLALVVASTALAGSYAGPKDWVPGEGAGTSFSSTWLRNYFATYGSGYDKTVTFIDNVRYGWHNTVRNKSDFTTTYPPYPGTFKGHCLSHSWFRGSCFIY
jgi:hypothetical protein